VLYGTRRRADDVSFIDEVGAHAGVSEAQMRTFLAYPPHVPSEAPRLRRARDRYHLAWGSGDLDPC